jgi:acyl carrier protein
VNRDEATTLARTCIREVAPEADLDSLPSQADLRETLHLDSLDFLQVVELLSTRSGVRIDEDDYPRLATMDSTVEFLTTTGGA